MSFDLRKCLLLSAFGAACFIAGCAVVYSLITVPLPHIQFALDCAPPQAI